MSSNTAGNCLTVGMFDGVHLGHQQVIMETIASAAKRGILSEVVTFENHPSSIIDPHKTKRLLTTHFHKLKLIEALNPDKITSIPFTKDFSAFTAKEFLEPYQPKALYLGYDARIGKDRSGDKEHLLNLSQEMRFDLHYIPPLIADNNPISSSRLRKVLEEGNLREVRKLLGRPYSIYSKVVAGEGRGSLIGFPTLNVDISSLALPPLGVWAVRVDSKRALANLGFAPTFNRPGPPILEVHLLEPYDFTTYIDVEFVEFIRKEIKFNSIEELKLQIKKDISSYPQH